MAVILDGMGMKQPKRHLKRDKFCLVYKSKCTLYGVYPYTGVRETGTDCSQKMAENE